MKTLNDIRKEYGFDKTSQTWLPQGAAFGELVKSELVYINYKKDGDKFITETKTIILDSFSDYDVRDTSYKITYRFVGERGVHTDRITPDGFKIGELTDSMFRVIPLSLYSKMIETEVFYERLPELYERKTISIHLIKLFSELNNATELANYCYNICAIMKNKDEYFYYRISSFTINDAGEGVYIIGLNDNKGISQVITINKDDEYYKMTLSSGEILDIKLIDIC